MDHVGGGLGGPGARGPCRGTSAGSDSSVDPGRQPYVLQVAFLASIDRLRPVTLAVDRLASGGRSSTCHALVRQGDTVVATVTVGLVEPKEPGDDEGSSGQRFVASRVTPPDHSTDWEELRFGETGERRPTPIEVRIASDPGAERPREREARAHAWMRPRVLLPADPVIQAAALTFASDLTLLRTAARHRGSAWAPRRAVTLNHTVWFHQPHLWSDWLLYSTESPVGHQQRALATGALGSEQGRILTSAQEGILQW